MRTTGLRGQPVPPHRSIQDARGATSSGSAAPRQQAPASAGKGGEAVNPAYCLQEEWLGSGARREQSLSVRRPVCTTGGLRLDRDQTGARALFWRGERLSGG